MIKIQNISKAYNVDSQKISILENINLNINYGQKVAIVGSSGSGKSTLLSIISGLDKPTSGKILYDDVDINSMSEGTISNFRNRKIGIIFQAFELVQFFTAYENVMLPLSIRGKENKNSKILVDKLFEDINLTHRKDNLPSALSGGEQQRVAIARVLASGCDIIFADEPTGNLDSINGKKVLNLLLTSVNENKKTLIIITHDINIAKQMDIIYEIKDGKISILENK